MSWCAHLASASRVKLGADQTHTAAGKYYDELMSVLQQPHRLAMEAAQQSCMARAAQHQPPQPPPNSELTGASASAPALFKTSPSAACSAARVTQGGGADVPCNGQHQHMCSKKTSMHSKSRFAAEARSPVPNQDMPAVRPSRREHDNSAAGLNRRRSSHAPAAYAGQHSCTPDVPSRHRQAALATGLSRSAEPSSAAHGSRQDSGTADVPSKQEHAGFAAGLSKSVEPSDASAQGSRLESGTPEASSIAGQGWLSREGRTRAQRHAMVLIETESSGGLLPRTAPTMQTICRGYAVSVYSHYCSVVYKQ